jgi:hypothetical protein
VTEEGLHELKISLEQKYGKEAPTMQDIVNVALTRLILAWEDPKQREQLITELLGSRAMSRSRMGKVKKSGNDREQK